MLGNVGFGSLAAILAEPRQEKSRALSGPGFLAWQRGTGLIQKAYETDPGDRSRKARGLGPTHCPGEPASAVPQPYDGMSYPSASIAEGEYYRRQQAHRP